MASYDPPPRSQRDGRPRYYNDDASDDDSYYAQSHRSRRSPPEERRAPPEGNLPPPPFPSDNPRRSRRPPPEDRRPPPEDRRPPPEDRRAPPEGDLPPPPFPSDNPRRPSILVSPDETASQRDFRRRSRSIDKVRLQPSSSDDEYDSRRGPPRPKLTRQLSHDLEYKTSDESKHFRSRRNDYESDEGETLRKSRQRSEGDPRKPRRRDYEGYDDGTRYPPERKEGELEGVKDNMSLPMRGKPRAADDRDGRKEPPVEYGAAPIAAAAAGAAAGTAIATRPRMRGYDTEPDRPSRPRTWGEDDFKRDRRRNRDRDRYDDNDYYDRRPPTRPRPRPAFTDDLDDAYGRSGGGPARRRDRYVDDVYDDYRPRDRDNPYRAERDRERDRDRSGALVPPRPRYDAYYSDSREDRVYPRARDRDRDRLRDRDRDRVKDRDPRGDYYDRRPRDRHREDYYEHDRRVGDDRRGGGNNDLQKQAGLLFTTYALPFIKKDALPFIRKEGTKFVKKELASFMEKRGGGI